MNKFQRTDALSRTVGKYICQNDSIEFDQGKGQYLPVMMGEAHVDGFVLGPAKDNMSCVIAITPVVAAMQPCMVRVEMATLSNPKALCEVLGARGIVIYSSSHASKHMLASAANAAKAPMRELVRKPGWIAEHRAFFTGNALITSREINADAFWFECSNGGVMRSRGELVIWRDQIGTLIVANPIMLAVSCIGMASILLGRLGLSSSVYNLFGEKGIGKTLALQGSASVFGNAVDPAQGAQAEDPTYIARFHGTINGYEPLLSQYSPMPALLDELTEANATVVKEICYMMASGQGKTRMEKNGQAAQKDRWQLNIVTTAEVTIKQIITESGKKMHGGQADRAIDIPISEVLSSYGTFESFNAVASHLKRACGEQYGTPGEAFIQYCCDNPDVVDNMLAMAPDIEERLLPSGCGAGERRVVKRFAGAVVAGRIAVLAGIFDQSAVEKIEDAIKLVTKSWWGARAMSLVLIRNFLDDNINEIQWGKPDLDSDATAFVDEDIIVIPVNVYHREFGEDAGRMLDELKGLNALVQEQSGRHVHRFCNGRFRGYAIKSKHVWPYENQHTE